MSIVYIGEQETLHYMMPSRGVWVHTLESLLPLMPVTIGSFLWMSGAWILHPSILWGDMRVRYFYRVGFVTSWVEYTGWYGTHLLGTKRFFVFVFLQAGFAGLLVHRMWFSSVVTQRRVACSFLPPNAWGCIHVYKMGSGCGCKKDTAWQGH